VEVGERDDDAPTADPGRVILPPWLGPDRGEWLVEVTDWLRELVASLRLGALVDSVPKASFRPAQHFMGILGAQAGRSAVGRQRSSSTKVIRTDTLARDTTHARTQFLSKERATQAARAGIIDSPYRGGMP
jgi:hypothetical protein